MTHQDGGVFEKGAKPAKKGGKKTASKNDSKELQNIPQGKFKVFKPSIDKNAIAEMTKGFLAEFVQKKASDTFLVPATVAASNTNTTNLQSK